ncbi:MAG: radical SAM protein [Promethearchaeota archaeon]
MGTCKFCGKTDKLISNVLQACRNCILTENWDDLKSHVLQVHAKIRSQVNLPSSQLVNSDSTKIKFSCNLCINKCKLKAGEVSYCGLRRLDVNGKPKMPFPTKTIGYLHGYLDPNPTNCCNAWFCPAGTGKGYPTYSTREGPELGTYSYAVFFYGCNFDCLFCQNASHKFISKRNLVHVEDIAKQIASNERITCLCYFGGDPEPHLPFSINLAHQTLKKIEKKGKRRVMRFCWEWNGSGRLDLMEECMKIALKTGGNIKFDLKSFNERLNIALCGISNERTLSNFKYLAKNYFGRRKDLPELSGCTLLVPGHINHEEVEEIARFIASVNEEIPYSLLIFHPDYKMKDLPITPRDQVEKCLQVAKKYLKNVHVGNMFLLQFQS